MAEKMYVVGAYVSNADPLLRVRRFIPLPTTYRTLDEAVAAAKQDYLKNDTPGADISILVYKSDTGDAIVEVNEGGVFKTAGFYKVALVDMETSNEIGGEG